MHGESHACSESVQSQYDWSNSTPSEAVINAIASLEGVEPTALPVELGTTLYDHVDPDALNTLVTGDNPHTISFIVDEYKIQIDGNTMVICYD